MHKPIDTIQELLDYKQILLNTLQFCESKLDTRVDITFVERTAFKSTTEFIIKAINDRTTNTETDPIKQ